jgi:hypothetical protein
MSEGGGDGQVAADEDSVIERFFGTLKYEHLYRGIIGDGDARDMEAHRFRPNRIKPCTTAPRSRHSLPRMVGRARRRS